MALLHRQRHKDEGQAGHPAWTHDDDRLFRFIILSSMPSIPPILYKSTKFSYLQVVDAAISESMFNMLEGCIPELVKYGFNRPPSGSTITGNSCSEKTDLASFNCFPRERMLRRTSFRCGAFGNI